MCTFTLKKPKILTTTAPPFHHRRQGGDDSESDAEAEDPNDPYGDGFGDNLMGDDADHAHLQGLTELEREEILADR